MAFHFFKKVFVNTVNRSEDKLGLYPEALNVASLPERRYLKTSRALCVIAVFSIVVSIFFGFLYFTMLPQLRSSVSFANYYLGSRLTYMDPSDNVIKRVMFSRKRDSAFRLANEAFIEKYITDRYSFKPIRYQMQEKWGENGPVKMATEQAVYTAFQQTYPDEINRLIRSKTTRTVHFYYVRHLRSNLFEAGYDVFSFTPKAHRELQSCACPDEEKECLFCKRKTATNVQHYTALIRTNDLNKNLSSKKLVLDNQNPLLLNIYEFIVFPKTKAASAF
jgi:hypothetical protein